MMTLTRFGYYKDFKEIYGDLSQEYYNLCEKKAELKKSLADLNDNEDDQDTLAIADVILEIQRNLEASKLQRSKAVETKAEIAVVKAQLKECCKYINQVEEMVSQVVAIPHRLVAEDTFFQVVSLSLLLCL